MVVAVVSVPAVEALFGDMAVVRVAQVVAERIAAFGRAAGSVERVARHLAERVVVGDQPAERFVAEAFF